MIVTPALYRGRFWLIYWAQPVVAKSGDVLEISKRQVLFWSSASEEVALAGYGYHYY